MWHFMFCIRVCRYWLRWGLSTSTTHRAYSWVNWKPNKFVDRNLTFYRQVFSVVFQFNIVCSNNIVCRISTYFSYSSYPYQTLQLLFVPKVNIICSDDNFSFNAYFTVTQLLNRHRGFGKPFRSTHITNTELLSTRRKLTHWDGQLDS